MWSEYKSEIDSHASDLFPSSRSLRSLARFVSLQDELRVSLDPFYTLPNLIHFLPALLQRCRNAPSSTRLALSPQFTSSVADTATAGHRSVFARHISSFSSTHAPRPATFEPTPARKAPAASPPPCAILRRRQAAGAAAYGSSRGRN